MNEVNGAPKRVRRVVYAKRRFARGERPEAVPEGRESEGGVE